MKTYDKIVEMVRRHEENPTGSSEALIAEILSTIRNSYIVVQDLGPEHGLHAELHESGDCGLAAVAEYVRSEWANGPGESVEIPTNGDTAVDAFYFYSDDEAYDIIPVVPPKPRS